MIACSILLPQSASSDVQSRLIQPCMHNTSLKIRDTKLEWSANKNWHHASASVDQFCIPKLIYCFSIGCFSLDSTTKYCSRSLNNISPSLLHASHGSHGSTWYWCSITLADQQKVSCNTLSMLMSTSDAFSWHQPFTFLPFSFMYAEVSQLKVKIHCCCFKS